MSETPPSAPPSPSGTKAKRPRGRPKRVDAPVVPWTEVDRLLVHGEAVAIEGAATKTRRFPPLSEVAERYGVTKTRIWQWASKHKCFERRKESEAREQIRYDRLIAARRAEARALGTEDVVAVVDGYIRGFQKELSEGKVRTDNPGDLDRMVRLKELMLGNADSRSELQGGLTLEAIQARHRKLRGQVEGMTPELAGTGHTSEPELAGISETSERELAGTTAELGGEEARDGAIH